MRHLRTLAIASLVAALGCDDSTTSEAPQADAAAPPVTLDGGTPPPPPPPGQDAAPPGPLTPAGLYVTDFSSSAVLRLDLEDGTIQKAYGKQGTGVGEFSGMLGLAATDRHIFLADRNNHRIVRLVDLSDADWTEWKISDTAEPYDVAAHAAADGSERLLYSDYAAKQYFFGDGNVFAGAPTPGAVIQFNACGVALKAGGEAASAGCSSAFASNVIVLPSTGAELHKDGFNRPDALAYMPDGTLLIADTGNNRVVCALGPSSGRFGSTGINTDLQFQGLASVTADAKGRIFVADSGRNRIVRFDDCKGTNPKVLFDDQPTIRQLARLAAVGPR
jgi:sugar lactone lactonase YvrE